ncbi:MAG: universal stress protein [Tabrizicola sp.]|uniref:universal stress protein n=1 Tax=Tabrizicola sp. TaxID=2005166 RepID=UPI002735808F|nr:universal stress protein [Tabrizicola sp.]MDP3261701.1 universal stress protein [Tabrizicola sp.]MDP3648229.1 universal stress protein [Paracoccaceae bacterium]
MIESLLLATRFTRQSVAALDRALLLMPGHADRIGVLHVVDPEVSVALVLGEGGTPPPILTDWLDARLPEGQARPEVLVRKGDPHEVILATADARDDDLIVLGPSRPGGLLAGLLGSTTDRVLRGGTRPVLSVRQPPQGPYRRVLIATDLSGASAFAARAAGRLGLLADARIRLVHAVDRVGGVDLEPAEAELRAFAARPDTGLPEGIEVSVLAGNPHMALRLAMDSFAPDLVILGTSGQSGLRHLVLGSVAEDLLDWVQVDVLVVPPEPEL